MAGDDLLSPPPIAYAQSAIASAMSAHEWRDIMDTWLNGKQVRLVAFDVLVDKGQLSVPWQVRYNSLSPAQGAFNYAVLSIATDMNRPQRIVAHIEVEIDGTPFVGVGYGSYDWSKQDSAAVPVVEAIRTLVNGMAEAAAGIAPLKRSRSESTPLPTQ